MKRILSIAVLSLALAVPLHMHAQDGQDPKTGGKNSDKLAPATKLTQKIVGAWKVQSQAEGNANATKNPTSGEWLEFRPDGRYLNRTAQPDSGSYRLNEAQGILYLESQLATSDKGEVLTEYNITMKDDNTMTLQRRTKSYDKQMAEKSKTDKQARGDKADKAKLDKTKYVYVRISQETSSIK